MARFKNKDAESLRSVRFNVQVTEEEEFQISFAAKIRFLPIAEFLRRTALGRKAVVKYDTEISLTLLRWNNMLRDMHSLYKSRGVEPPLKLMEISLFAGLAALNRVSINRKKS